MQCSLITVNSSFKVSHLQLVLQSLKLILYSYLLSIWKGIFFLFFVSTFLKATLYYISYNSHLIRYGYVMFCEEMLILWYCLSLFPESYFVPWVVWNLAGFLADPSVTEQFFNGFGFQLWQMTAWYNIAIYIFRDQAIQHNGSRSRKWMDY